MPRLLALLLCLLPLTSDAALPTPDAAFLFARDAYRANSPVRLAQALPDVAGHVLEPYVRYWDLRLRLPQAAPAEVSDFLNRYAGTLVAENLRKDWLRLLASQGEWEMFEAGYRDLQSEDTELACYHEQNLSRPGLPQRAAQTVDSGAEVARALWDGTRDLPEACMPLIDAQVASGAISSAEVWDRVHRLWEVGQNSAAQRSALYLPAAETPDNKRMDAIARNPIRFLERADRLNLSQRLDREMFVFALTRAAIRDPEIAVGYWSDEIQRRYAPAERAYIWAMLATRAAKSQLPLALGWFAQSQSGTAPFRLSEDQQQWRVRAALRAGDWTAVRSGIEAMNTALRAEPAWIYWYARALAAQGERERAQQLYAQIADGAHFYGVLAKEEMGESLRIPLRTESISADELGAAAANPGLQRAIALFANDMYLDGVREWNWSIRKMNDRQLLAAAEAAQSAHLWDRAINTADRTVSTHDYSLRYLAPYRELFAAYAREQGLEEGWVLGLVRQESRFIAHARSGAGAQGLMQVMPATAKWIAKRIGMSGYRSNMVAEVDTNIALGTGYLRYVLDELDGSQVLAAAAYNAGPGRARRWKADRPLEGAIYAETIPFNETRDYVKKVMTNAEYYAALYGGDRRGLKARLGTIAPREGGEGYAATITGQATVQ